LTALVTGATGHLGANLVRALVDRGEHVRALVRRDSGALAGLEGVDQVHGDILSPESLAPALDGVDSVFHLAGKISIWGDPDRTVFRVNVEGTENILQAALSSGTKRFIHCSSVQAFDLYSSSTSAIDETLPLATADSRASAYDCSKAEGERRVHAAIGRGLNAVIVNPTGVIGPVDFGPSRLGQVLLDLRDRTIPSLIGGGFDFVDVRDVAEGMIGAREQGRTGENYLLGNRRVTVAELAAAAAEVTGSAPPRFCCPLWLGRASAIFVEIGARLTSSNPLYTRESIQILSITGEISHQKAEREIGFSVRPLEQTVGDIYRHFSLVGM
jgi:dihydroflavonol-4-reductase